MSDAFEPLKISKSNVGDCVKTVLSAIVRSPWTMSLSASVYVAFHLILSGDLRFEFSVWGILQASFFYIMLIQAPAFLGSYMMYREGYGISWSQFLLILRGQHYHVYCMAPHIGIMAALVLIHLLLGFSSEVKNMPPPEIAGQGLVILYPLIMAFYMAVMYMLMKELVEIRTGSDPGFTSNYVTKAIKMNLNALFINVALITALESLVPSILYGLPIGDAIKWVFFILSGMFWTYVLFGNTFKKKESEDKVIHAKMQSEST